MTLLDEEDDGERKGSSTLSSPIWLSLSFVNDMGSMLHANEQTLPGEYA